MEVAQTFSAPAIEAVALPGTDRAPSEDQLLGRDAVFVGYLGFSLRYHLSEVVTVDSHRQFLMAEATVKGWE
jgi:hypothetical protein